MTAAVVVPLVSAVVIASIVTALHRRVRPQLSAVLLTSAIVGVAVAVIPTMVVLAIGYLAHLPYLGGGFEWCRSVLGFHAAVNPWLGATSTVALGVGVFRVSRSVQAWRGLRCVCTGEPAVVDSDEWFAYSLPGPGRRVAWSSGLVGALDREELEVVLAHERGHTDHRHDRHLLVAELAASLVPPLEPLCRRLRFSLERWADESAVSALGGDRKRVAVTLARVALGPASLSGAVAGFNGLGVAARVDALMWPRPLNREGWWCSVIGLGVVAVVVVAAVQAHHVAALAVTLCPG